MLFLCEKVTRQDGTGVRILKCRSLDTMAVVPEMVRGLPVRELASYAFSSHSAYGVKESPEAFWWDVEAPAAEGAETGSGEKTPAAEETEIGSGQDALAAEKDGSADRARELPPLEGNRLEEVVLPRSLQKVGAYAFYNCGNLKMLEVYSTTLDWGAGVFNGCRAVKELVLHVDEQRPSAMREILAELRQTLDVWYLAEGTDERTRLVFPEYFEEAVENTPARILVTETHGCGQRYRNAFVQTQFQFKEYDMLFAHVQVQEPEALTARLALGRLMYPYRLEESCRRIYLEYLSGHAAAAGAGAVRSGRMDQLQWLFEHVTYDGTQMDELLEIAGKAGNGGAVSYLMEQKRRSGTVKRRRFSL